MAGRINQLQHNAARLKVSAEEASQKAWEGFSMGYGGLSYYLKGSLLGLVFDVKIRAATDNAKSLDDVMRLLDAQYGKPGKGYEEDGLLKAINEVSGKDFTDAYYRYVRSTEEIPWNDILKDAGLKYEEGMEKIPYLGVQLRTNTGSTVIIDKVQEETSASSAGLQDGDRIITVNGARITPDTFSPALGKLRVGQHFLIGIRRGDKGVDVPITLGSREVRYIRLAPIPDADAREQKIRAGLLRSTVGNATVAR
jgi:predicted metalloprotease with PDZ domain